jgi:hypothetical protein
MTLPFHSTHRKDAPNRLNLLEFSEISVNQVALTTIFWGSFCNKNSIKMQPKRHRRFTRTSGRATGRNSKSRDPEGAAST